MAKNPNKNDNTKKKSRHIGLIIGLTILIIIVAGGAYLYESYGTITPTLISAISSGKPLNAQTFESIAMQKLASENVTANYSGSVTLKSDPKLKLSFLDLFGRYFYQLTTTNLTGFGSPSIYSSWNKSNASEDWFCVTGSPYLANAIKTGFNVSEYKCYNNSINNYPSLVNSFSLVNMFIDLQNLSDANIPSSNFSNYNGYPCYGLKGNGTLMVNSTVMNMSGGYYTPVKSHFITCISSKYMLPLFMDANFTASNGVTVLINLSTTGIIIPNASYLGRTIPSSLYLNKKTP